MLELKKKGTISKGTDPTKWISSMIIIPKPGKLRICLDPRDLKKALKRPKHQMPTLEEILRRYSPPLMTKISIHEHSNTKTTFLTPFWKYKYLQMPFGVSPAPEVSERKLHEKLDDLLGIVVTQDDILIMGQATPINKQ